VSEVDLQAAQRTAATIAFRHIDEVSVSEREHVLIALIDALPEAEAAVAEQMLFHMREERRLQLELGLALGGGKL
jgi:hypothetical protein